MAEATAALILAHQMGQQPEERQEGLRDHIIILGWNSRVHRIIKELRDEVHRISGELRPILIVASQPIVAADGSDKLTSFERVYFVYGKINDPAVLRRANLDTAYAVLIPISFLDTQSVDGEAVFSLLAALSVNPSVRICVEMASAENSEMLEQIRQTVLGSNGIEIVAFESVAERLLAQAAVNRGVTRVYNHLLSFGETTNEIYVTALGARWFGKSFRELAHGLYESGILLLGYERGEELEVNPQDRGVILQQGDKVWFIALNKGQGVKLINQAS